MPEAVYFLIVQEAHKEYNSLTDQIQAKYEQLDSDEYKTVATPAFNAEACELANLLAHVSQLCQKLSLQPPKELYRPTFFKHWRCFSDQNYRQTVWLRYGGCSFVSRYVRITGLLSTPLVLRIGNWLCNHPCSLTSPRKLTRLPPQNGEQLNPQDRRHSRSSVTFPLGWTRSHFIQSRVFTPHSTLYTVLCKSHKHQYQQSRQT